MSCPHCGSDPSEHGELYCRRCGGDLRDPGWRRPAARILAAVGLSAFAVVVAAILYSWVGPALVAAVAATLPEGAAASAIAPSIVIFAACFLASLVPMLVRR